MAARGPNNRFCMRPPGRMQNRATCDRIRRILFGKRLSGQPQSVTLLDAQVDLLLALLYRLRAVLPVRMVEVRRGNSCTWYLAVLSWLPPSARSRRRSG